MVAAVITSPADVVTFISVVTCGDHNSESRLTRALMVATINGAYASHEENVKGSSTAGKLADFTMLEKDLHDVNPDAIKNIRVLRTVVGGKTVREA